MTTTEWLLVAACVAVAALALLWVISAAATRLDRLHRKIVTAWTVLDTQLVRRASVAAELAGSGLLDPASAIILADASLSALGQSTDAVDDEVTAGAAIGSTAISGPELVAVLEPGLVRDDETRAREVTEGELSRTLHRILDDPSAVARLREDPVGDNLIRALSDTWYRVQFARRFHNDAVAQTLRLRRSPLVRILHLAGRAPMPAMFEADDELPQPIA